MAEMRIAFLRPHFGPHHVETVVEFFHDVLRPDGFCETGEAGPGIVFVERGKERLVRDDVDVKAGFVVVPMLIVERRLGSVLARNVELLGIELVAQLRIGRDREFVGMRLGRNLLVLRIAPPNDADRDENSRDESDQQRELGGRRRRMMDSCHYESEALIGKRISASRLRDFLLTG